MSLKKIWLCIKRELYGDRFILVNYLRLSTKIDLSSGQPTLFHVIHV